MEVVNDRYLRFSQQQVEITGCVSRFRRRYIFSDRGASTRLAKTVCRRCEVQEECLEYAVNNREKFGIWGGLSERERRRAIRKKRAVVINSHRSA